MDLIIGSHVSFKNDTQFIGQEPRGGKSSSVYLPSTSISKYPLLSSNILFL